MELIRSSGLMPPDPETDEPAAASVEPMPPSEGRRAYGYKRFILFFNHHRSHGALDWATPMATLNHLNEDNLTAKHN